MTIQTTISKGRDGWQAESMTEADVNGNAWQISTYKTRKGVTCIAILGTLENQMFSYDMFGGKRVELANQEGQCNENKVKAVHAEGLAAFEKQQEETKESAP